MSNEISIVSLNCQGLGDLRKRRDVFHYIRQKKHSIYFLQDTHFSPKLEQYIKAEWGYTAFFSSKNSNSRGVAILFDNNFEFKVKGTYKDTEGNVLMVHVYITLMNKDILLVNVYGPNRDDPEFYNVLNEQIKSKNIPNLICAGDWNLVLDPNKDYYNYRNVNNPRATEQLEKIMEDFALIDIWRTYNPLLERFTWRRSNPLQQSRLDYFLVSESICNFVRDADIRPGYRTDHSMITLDLIFGENTKRNTFWKFNSSLLRDYTYVKQINDIIESTIEQYAASPYDRNNLKNIETEEISFTISDQLFLDVLLMEIRSKTIAYSTAKKKESVALEKHLEKEISYLEGKIDKNEKDIQDIKEANKKLCEIRQKKMEGVLLRSKARWVGEGEKITKYFCGLEKRNYISKQMTKLIDKNGSTLVETKDIVQETKMFYENLYKKREVTECDIHNVANNLPTLEDEEASSLEGEISLQEATAVLKKMNNGKSPGTDGFTVEFFKVFWKKRLGGLVVRSINEAFVKGEMSTTQKEGIIICIPKGDKPREYLKNWRPISLLNVVYKIATACIAERMKTVLPKLIKDDQTGFMANRYIGSNTRLIYDLINHCNTNNVKGLLLGIDFEKAFDSLDWNFMHRVLSAFGFKEDLRKWINIFYTNIKSTVLVNGQSSPWFEIKRGCRQGDPISPYLFVLCAEILATMIRENKDIIGIRIGETEHKISQFADDTELFQNGERKTFEETIYTIEFFGQISGLKINIEKTFVVWFGSALNSPVRYMPHLRFEWNPGKFRILGIWFTADLARCEKLNFEEKLQEIKQLFTVWLKRLITPLGRIAVLKSLILSKLVHLWLLLPNPPDASVEKLQKMVFSFVWNKKQDRISRKTAIKNIQEGGLGIPDIKTFINALKLTWIQKLQKTEHKWKDILTHVYPDINKTQILGPGLYGNSNHANKFWEDVFKIYDQFWYKSKPSTAEELLAEPIFHNRNVQIGNKIIFHRDWINKGVYKIGHLIDDTGEFYSYQRFSAKYGIRINPLSYLGCVHAVKQFAKKLGIIIDNNKSDSVPKPLRIIASNQKGTRVYYDILTQGDKRPNCCSKWEALFNEEIDWKKCFSKTRKIQEVKLRWFQIRILHRILATNVVLKEMGVVESNKCTQCDREKDSILHGLWECDSSKAFWNEFLGFFHVHCTNAQTLTLNKKIIILGIDNALKSDYVFDYILLCAKFYIYKCRNEKGRPSLDVFRKILKQRYEIEQYNHKLKMNELTFKLSWLPYMSLITDIT